MFKKLLSSSGVWLLLFFFFYVLLSWILFYQDTRALLAISNFFPYLRTSLFATQTTLMHYKLNTVPTLLFTIFGVGSFYFYFQSLKQTISLRKTIIYSLLFGFVIFLSYPTLSSDIFSYIFSDRIATVYHQNVWLVAPITHNSDPFAIMADWKNTTNVYGEVNHLLYAIPSMLGGNKVILLVVLYKMLSSIFTVGILFVLYLHISPKEKKEKVARNIRLLFWNPLFLLELFGSGHNDSIMLFFTLLSYYFFNKKNYVVAGIALAFAVQVKLIPILFFVFLLVSLVKKNAYKESALFLISFGFINALSFWLMGVSPFTFAQRVSYNAGVYWQSLPNLLTHINPHSNYLFTSVFLIVFCLLIIYQIRTKQSPLFLYAYSLIFYLFFFTTAYWNWYALWIFAVVPILQNARFKFFVLTFTFTSLLAYPLLWLSLRYDYHNIMWTIVTYLFIFIVPAGVYFLTKRKIFAKQLALFE